ncbi:MAG: hypothetical protein D6786_08120 [Gammaproteobacteria bacterium]|nr:MAG: hypothetical protein D6786_08120 [Gammaproteobacteria bacterium]
MERNVSVLPPVPAEFDLTDLIERQPRWFGQAPGQHHPPEQLVILVDRKPIALDTVVPLALELHAEQPGLPIIWLFKDRAHLPAVRSNHVLWRAMQESGTIAHLGSAGRAGGRLALLVWMWRLSRRRTLLLNHGDFASTPVDLLAAAARRGGGRMAGYARWCYPMSRPRYEGILANQLRKRGVREHYRNGGDLWLIPHPLHAAHVATLVSSPLVVTGTPRAFPAWRRHLERCLDEEGILDLEGRALDCRERPVLAIFYPGNHPIRDLVGPTACRDQLWNILHAVRRRVPKALVLIKPHLICDLEELRGDLAEFGDLEIRLTCSHPQLLGRVSRAAFFTNGSNVMDDMYLEGVPVIDTARYQPWVLAAGGSQFPNPGRLAAIEPEEIEQALQRVLEEPESVPKAELGHLLWPKANSISACLWGMQAA